MHLLRARSVGGQLILIPVLLLGSSSAQAATTSPLYARGYTVIPEPQRVELKGADFQFDGGWRIGLGLGVEAGDVAVQSLKEEMSSRYGLTLETDHRQGGKAIQLAVQPGSVEIGEATDNNKKAIEEQAYKLELATDGIRIAANAPTGLFYGVDTLLQLVKPAAGKLWLPQGKVIDWPDLGLRVILWDDTFHLEHLEVLKAAIRQAAFYKINGFTLKLCGHFQYKSAGPVVEPYALSPSDYQELTDYGLRYHLQVIPYVDAPGHDTFILKHPEYATLREFPESNYEFCITNPGTYNLLLAMFQDLMDANKGVKYILLSTDEPYYVGLANNSQCDEVGRAQQLGSVGKLLAEFTTRISEHLHECGRTVIFWGEYPLKPNDIPALPSFLINGEVYGPEFDRAFRAHGIQQMIYTWTGGETPHFPIYYHLAETERVHPAPADVGSVTRMFDTISFTSARGQADLMGAVVAGWRDAGVHPEAFWLGYTTGLAYAWHPAAPSPQEATSAFFPLFYGPGATNMGRVYRLMSEQAQFWDDSWETVPSNARTPLFGDPYAIFTPPRPAYDQALPPLPVPSAGILTVGYEWRERNARRLQLAEKFLTENDELTDLLLTNLRRAEFNRYNLMVFLSIARLCRQNLEMLLDMGRISDALKSAQDAAAAAQAAPALAAIDMALDTAQMILRQRNSALDDVNFTWYQDWFPRIAEANGRRHLSTLNDAKDSLADRTVDLSYLIHRELLLPLGEWYEQVEAARNGYARKYALPVRTDKLHWEDYATVIH